MDMEKAKCVLGFWLLSNRVILLKLKDKPVNTSIIMVYAPTSDSTDDETGNFYNTLNHAKFQCKSQEVVSVLGASNVNRDERSQ